MHEPEPEALEHVAAQSLELCGGGLCRACLGLFDQWIDDKRLAPVGDLLAHQGVSDFALGRRHDESSHGCSTGRELVDHRDRHLAIEREGERARDRRRGHGQEVRAAPSLGPQQLSLARAEAMLLVDHRQAQLGELHVLLDQGMRTHDKGAMARGGSSSYAPALGCRLPADQKLDRESGKALLEVGSELSQVLSGQDLGGRHDHGLQTGRMSHGDTCRRHGRFARTDVSIEQTIHRHCQPHVLERLPRRATLSARELEANAGLERVDDVLAIRDGRRRLRRLPGSHECECHL